MTYIIKVLPLSRWIDVLKLLIHFFPKRGYSNRKWLNHISSELKRGVAIPLLKIVMIPWKRQEERCSAMLTLIKEDKITSTFSTPIGYFRVPVESEKTAPSVGKSRHGYLDYFQVVLEIHSNESNPLNRFTKMILFMFILIIAENKSRTANSEIQNRTKYKISTELSKKKYIN